MIIVVSLHALHVEPLGWVPTIEVSLKRLKQLPEKLTDLGHIFESDIDRSETLAVHADFGAPQVELSKLARRPITFSGLDDVSLSLFIP
jgi:hypothetical protein